MVHLKLITASILSAVLLASPASASVFTGSATGTEGGNLAAEVSFDVNDDGDLLTVILTNTSAADVVNPSGVLTSVFFDVDGDHMLTRVSALLGDGSVVLFDDAPTGGVVGGEWAYASGISGPSGTTQVISSTGAGDFVSAADRFPGPDLDNPENPNGLNYGIVSAGDDQNVGNAKVTGGTPLIKNSVIFTLSAPENVTLSMADFSNVVFQYGTSLDQPRFPGEPPEPPGPPPTEVPEPTTLALLGLGLAGMGLSRRRRRTR